MLRTRILTAGALAVLIALAACAPGAGAKLVGELGARPGMQPPEIRSGETVVLVTLTLGQSRATFDGAPILQPRSRLGLERALAVRRTALPAYWVVVTSPDGRDVRYWTGANGQARVRTIVHGVKRVRGMTNASEGELTSVRVPFVRSGRIEVYDSAGHRTGAFRFGLEPESPLQTLAP